MPSKRELQQLQKKIEEVNKAQKLQEEQFKLSLISLEAQIKALGNTNTKQYKSLTTLQSESTTEKIHLKSKAYELNTSLQNTQDERDNFLESYRLLILQIESLKSQLQQEQLIYSRDTQRLSKQLEPQLM